MRCQPRLLNTWIMATNLATDFPSKVIALIFKVTNLATDFPSEVKHFNSPTLPRIFCWIRRQFFFFHHQTSEAFETTHVSRDSRVSNQNFQVLQRNVFTCVSAIAWCRPTVWILRFDIFGGLFVESTFQMNTLRERIRCTSLSNGCKIPGSPRYLGWVWMNMSLQHIQCRSSELHGL